MKNPRGKKRYGRVKKIILALAVLFICVICYNRIFGDILRKVPFSAYYTDRNGKLLNAFLTGDDKYRFRTTLANFPPVLVEAVLLQEDRYFYGHIGINPAAIFRAVNETYIKRSRRVGASTITMQLARLRWGLYTRSLAGKFLQILGSLFLEASYSKEEILEAYLNLVPLGGNIEGYAAGSWYYFGKDVRELTRGEILTLAVIPQNPSSRAPLSGIAGDELLRSRRILYDAWLDVHPEDSLLEAEMEMPPYIRAAWPRRALHLTEYLKAFFPQGATKTSLDLGYQNILERQLENFLVKNRSWGIRNGSLLLVDYTSMEVLAAVGSADYFDDAIQGQVNGFSSRRSPGSTLKPFVYALAIEQGLIHPEKMLKDTPVGFSEYTPDNYQSEFMGPVQAWRALVDSRNIPAVELARNIHDPDLYDFLLRAGIGGLREKDHYGLSLVLGSAGLTMIELVRLYAALASGGMEKELRFFDSGAGAAAGAGAAVGAGGAAGAGAAIGAAGQAGRPLLTEEAAAITLSMLERNPAPDQITDGSGRNIPVAYKTGTSIGFKDAWSIAVFDRFVLAVWLGNFSGEGNSAFIGRLTATPLQFGIIDAVSAGIPQAELLPPKPMPRRAAWVDVCAVSGDLPGEDCPRLTGTWFIPGVSPITTCRIHRRIYIDTRTGYRTDEREGPHIRSEVREFWPSDLMEIFNLAGLPRFTAPPYAPDHPSSRETPGFPPSIISPLANSTYVLTGNDRYNQLVLLAGADQDGGELFWFAGAQFIGRTKPNERFVWSPEPGIWDISVVDTQGRSSGIRITVQRMPQ
ncbi:MAG: penicillin-binding protein 1C [Spirochaetaceae bacterium]|jgi:penicillin-binding protein 1C|nr:penicillin-binding protein 1C [Spirochaetaceae bacterium]